MTRDASRLHWLGFGLVMLVTQVVYLQTMTLTCPFWDSGEFIATSYILGIPHPPGTPLYVLIGRFFTLLPIFPLIATRVNWLSALASSLGAAFTGLMVAELWWRVRGGVGSRVGSAAGGSGAVGPLTPNGSRGLGGWIGSARRAWPEQWPGLVAGVTAGLFLAFSRTYWDNAIEAEVYALSSLLMALSGWLILRWARWDGDRLGKNGLFALLYYLLCLSMGIHLGTFLVLPGIIFFALLVDRSSFGEGRSSAWFVAGLLLLLHPGMLPTLGLKVWGPLVGLVALSAVLFGGKWPAVGRKGILSWCLVLALVGISTHFYLMIRAKANPAINEADPETWGALWKVLTRDQYKPPNPFLERQAPWSVQLGKHFWDYARDQYALGLRPAWVGWLLPYLLGLWGAVGQARRDRKGFALVGVSYLIMSLGLVFYLNFKTEEVRPRDYFFVASFQFFAIWIGLGAAWLVSWLGRSVAGAGSAAVGSPVPAGSSRWLAVGGGVLLCLLPFSTCRHYWREHDRTKFWVARDFAYNMLTPLKPNAILFTNGDNDTFPLWYLQQVEGIRKDVQVANLSLLNTDWYIRQLRDMKPSVDFGWTNQEVQDVEFFSTAMTGYRMGMINREQFERFLQESGLRPYVRSLDEPLLAKDVAVARIVEREKGKRPIYLALTVPEQMGLEKSLVQKGVAFELESPSSTPERVDAAETVRLLKEVYLFRGLLGPDRKHDYSVYKDENSSRIVQNYSAAAIAAAQELRAQGELAASDEMVTLGLELTPGSLPVLYSLAILKLDQKDWKGAEEVVRSLVDDGVVDGRLYRLLGRSYEGQGRLEEAEAQYRRSLEVSPGSFETMRDLFSLFWVIKGDKPGGLAVLDDWIRRHPDDRMVREARRVYGDSIGM